MYQPIVTFSPRSPSASNKRGPPWGAALQVVRGLWLGTFGPQASRFLIRQNWIRPPMNTRSKSSSSIGTLLILPVGEKASEFVTSEISGVMCW